MAGARVGVGEGGSVSVWPVVSWEAVIRLLDPVVTLASSGHSIDVFRET